MDEFLFKNFTADESLRLRSDRALDRIVEMAPEDAVIHAVLEPDGQAFRCSIEIGSSTFPITVQATHRLAALAIDRAELMVRRKLGRWRGKNFLRFDRLNTSA